MGFAYQPLFSGAGDDDAAIFGADAGTTLVAGQMISVSLSRRIAADGLVVATTGQETAFSRTKTVMADNASVAVSGASCRVSRGLRLIANSGSTTLSGQVAAMTWHGVFIADMGELSVSLTDANIRFFRSITPLETAAGRIFAEGQNCAIGALRRATLATGTITVTDKPVSLYRHTPGTPPTGAVLPRAVGFRIGL